MKSDPPYASGPRRGPDGRGASAGLLSFQRDVALHWVFPHQCIASLGPSRTARPDPNSDFSPNQIGVVPRAVLPRTIVGSSSQCQSPRGSLNWGSCS